MLVIIGFLEVKKLKTVLYHDISKAYQMLTVLVPQTGYVECVIVI